MLVVFRCMKLIVCFASTTLYNFQDLWEKKTTLTGWGLMACVFSRGLCYYLPLMHRFLKNVSMQNTVSTFKSALSAAVWYFVQCILQVCKYLDCQNRGTVMLLLILFTVHKANGEAMALLSLYGLSFFSFFLVLVSMNQYDGYDFHSLFIVTSCHSQFYAEASWPHLLQ